MIIQTREAKKERKSERAREKQQKEEKGESKRVRLNVGNDRRHGQRRKEKQGG